MTETTRKLPRPKPPPSGPMPPRWDSTDEFRLVGDRDVARVYRHASGTSELLHYVNRRVPTMQVMQTGLMTAAEAADVSRDVTELCTWIARGGPARVA